MNVGEEMWGDEFYSVFKRDPRLYPDYNLKDNIPISKGEPVVIRLDDNRSEFECVSNHQVIVDRYAPIPEARLS
jgi:hypothetical protein